MLAGRGRPPPERLGAVAVRAVLLLADAQDHIVGVTAKLDGDALEFLGRGEGDAERVDAMPGPAVKAGTALKGELLVLFFRQSCLCPPPFPPVENAAGNLRKRDDRDERRRQAAAIVQVPLAVPLMQTA